MSTTGPGGGPTPPTDPGSPHGRLPYPPGFYRSIHHRLPPFAAVGILSVFIALLPFPNGALPEVVVGLVLFIVLTAVAMFVPWRRTPKWTWSLIPIGYIVVIALFRDAQGADRSALFTLYLLPVVWLAFYGRLGDLLAGLAAAILALVMPVVLIGTPDYPPYEWRMIVVSTAVGLLVALTIFNMVAHDRARVHLLQQRSLAADRSAQLASSAREQLDHVLSSATDTVIIEMDIRGRITFFSAGAERWLGYTSDEAVGMAIFQLGDPAELRARSDEIDEMLAVARGRVTSPRLGEESIWTYYRKDGTPRQASMVLTVRLQGDRAAGYVAVAHDVTEREQLAVERDRLWAAQREVTEALTEQNHQLRQLTQMKDDVVATVSHELRTPLTSIRGYLELLGDDEHSLTEEQRTLLGIIDRNAVQLLRVTEDLLHDPGGGAALRVHFVDVDLTTVAQDAIDSIGTQAAARDLQVALEAGAPVSIRGDVPRLRQLIDNLLANAVKFAPPSGHVAVRVDVLGSFAQLKVMNDGPPIPEPERDQIFERFYRLASSADRGIPGSGLGLAIAKAVAEAHEGTIDIVDTPGWPTTFRVLFPLLAPDVEPGGPGAPSAATEPERLGTSPA